MLESRDCYGWGLVGSAQKGFEWLLVYGDKPHERLRSGDVYETEEKAIRAGKEYLKGNAYYSSIDCYISAVKAEPLHFEY